MYEEPEHVRTLGTRSLIRNSKPWSMFFDSHTTAGILTLRAQHCSVCSNMFAKCWKEHVRDDPKNMLQVTVHSGAGETIDMVPINQ